MAIGLLLMRTPVVGARHRPRPTRPPAIDVGPLPIVLDLAAVALRAGAPPGPALAAAGQAAGPGLRHVLAQVSGLLSLGVEPAAAWADARHVPGLSTVACLATRSGHSGIRLADVLTATAAELRQEGLDRAQQAAARAGVWAVLPLGLCFLPAFVCLGVVPAVVGVAGQLGPVLALR